MVLLNKNGIFFPKWNQGSVRFDQPGVRFDQPGVRFDQTRLYQLPTAPSAE